MKIMSRTGLLCLGIFFLAVAAGEGQSPTPSPRDVAPPTAVSADQSGTEAETERIIVTGSNIPTAEEVGPNPVQTIDRAFIEKSGERTAEQLLRNLPVAGPQGVPSFNGQNFFAPGASSISLRGFDPSDTLVLIDGRRVATYPQGAGGAGTQSFVDLNSIPKAAIESIEILKDSASTTYGADAVAGVVNIKLRHDYHGAEASVEYGNTLDKDSSEFASSVLFGVGDGTTNVSGVLNYYHRNSLFDVDRAFSASGFSTNSSPANLQFSRAAVIGAGVPAAGLPEGDTFFGHSPFSGNGLAPALAYTYTTSRSSFFNFEPGRSAVPDSERYGGFVNANHKVFGDQLVFYGDLSYENVETVHSLAPSPTGFFDSPGRAVVAIPPHAPGATLGGPSYDETGVSLGAFNPFNPFQQIISGGSRARLAEFGNRAIDNETDAFFSTLGFKGDKLFDGSWGYDAGFRYSEIKNTGTGNTVSTSRFNRILNAADPIFDPTSSQFIGTTLPYNPFGDARVPIQSNAPTIAFATIHPTEVDISKLATLDLNIYTTELFKLPAGGIGLAFGGQFRREALRQNPDELSASGDLLNQTAFATTNAGRKTYGLYAETDLPIFGASFAAPGFHALEFTAAVRYEEFRSNGSNVVVPKFGLRWQPFDESLTVRATWGEGFHEPSLIELFGNPLQGLTDSSRGLFENETPFVIRSNPNLQPEDSRAFSGGVVYTPKFIPGLTLTIDLFDIESTGRVNSTPNPDNIVQRDLEGRSLPGETVFRDANGNVTSIEATYQNGGSQKARGADFGIQYQLETRFGTFTSLTQATYLDSFQFSESPGLPEIELRGSASPFGLFSAEGYLKWKGTSRLDWAWKNFDLVGTVIYRDGFHEHQRNGLIHYVKQTWFFDGQASYNFSFPSPVGSHPVAGYSKGASEMDLGRDGKPIASAAEQTANSGIPVWKRLLNGTTLTLGCNDIFGQDPPKSGGGYPVFAYDPTGRFVYVSVTKKF